MSLEALEKAWKSRAEPAHKLVLLAVADGADEYGAALVNLERIADKCNMDKAAVLTSLQVLQALGEVRIEGRREDTLLVRVFPQHEFRPGRSPLAQMFRGGV